MDAIERLALSVGLSFAVVALLGLGLNYTTWGIRLWPSIIAGGSFIVAASAIAEYRRRRAPPEERYSIDINLSKSSLGETRLSRALSVVLILAVLGTIGTLVYTAAFPKVGERFTQFYLLGLGGAAINYPVDFTMTNGIVTSISYDQGGILHAATGQLTIGIINNQQQETTYEVELLIDGVVASIQADGTIVGQLGPITLQNNEKWEKEIGFEPSHTGDNQRVDFVLLVDGKPYFQDPPHIWINVTSTS
jgi:uncharacterized membrane protein